MKENYFDTYNRHKGLNYMKNYISYSLETQNVDVLALTEMWLCNGDNIIIINISILLF